MGPGPGPDGGRGAKIEIVTTILAFLFVLGVLVFVHELGHFLAARRLGIKVITFSLGFGPKLLTTHRDGVEYAISAIPLGGYVKMAGESVEETRTGAPDEFLSKSKWERFQVLIMGPVMNIALAVVVMAGVLYQGAEVEHRRELDAARARNDIVAAEECVKRAFATDVRDALATYQHARLERATRIQQGSNENEWLRTGTNADWVYGHDAWTCPVGG